MTERSALVDRWAERLGTIRRVALDSNAVIYAVEGTQPYAALMAHALGRIARRLMTGLVFTLVEMEVLVKPLREQDEPARERAEFFFRAMPNLSVRGVDRGVARRAALIRAMTRLPAPDAIIVATALESGCDAIVGNDRRMARQSTAIPYLCLDDYVQ